MTKTKKQPGTRVRSVWDVLEDTRGDAESMKLRSELMIALKQRITTTKMREVDAAALFGVTQPRLSDLMHGKIELFALDTLVDMAACCDETRGHRSCLRHNHSSPA